MYKLTYAIVENIIIRNLKPECHSSNIPSNVKNTLVYFYL